jgi:hypothetical protein
MAPVLTVPAEPTSTCDYERPWIQGPLPFSDVSRDSG